MELVQHRSKKKPQAIFTAVENASIEQNQLKHTCTGVCQKLKREAHKGSKPFITLK